ncbi:MAG: hypothetical protein HT579_04305 [Candidatus Accumulibacter similis]|nr:MAG: hypothetical protein HT579_04305 [Candidatus Accumulibacter similis]
MTRMRYPQATPTVFSGAKAFVEQHGVTVWCELCDTVTPDQWFHVTATARQLDCLRRYSKPERYLQAVLKAVIADFEERPDAYECRPPVQLKGLRMTEAKV